MRNIASQINEIRVRIEAIKIEMLRGASHSARMKSHAEVRRRNRTLRRPGRGVVGAEWIIVNWGRRELAGNGDVLIEMFVVEAERERMEEVRQLRESENGASADDFAASDNIDRAEGRDVRELLYPLER